MYQSFEVAELARKLSNMILAGVVYEADYTKARLRVKSGELVTAWLPWLTLRAGNDSVWWTPEVGEQVVVLCPDGDPAQGWVLPSAFTDSSQPPESSPDMAVVRFKDGAFIRYNRTAHHMDISLPDSATLNIVSKGGCTITGNLTVTGNITATMDVSDSTRSMAKDREIYNSHDHAGNVPPPKKTQ